MKIAQYFCITILYFFLIHCSLANDSFNLCSPQKIAQSKLNLGQNIPTELLNLNKVISVPEEKVVVDKFEKNGYNPKNRTVWREIDPRDGQVWWRDDVLGIFWRYLRPNENPQTLTIPITQNTIRQDCVT